jgi:hypothetical protein
MQNIDAEKALTALLNELTLTAANNASGSTGRESIAGITPDAASSSIEITKMLAPVYVQQASTINGADAAATFNSNTSDLKAELQRTTGQAANTLAPVSVQQPSTISGANGATASSNTNNSGSNNSELESELQRLTGQVTLLRQVNELNQEVLSENTKALAQAGTSQSQSSGAASTAKSIGSYLLGGLGIGSLISGIASLFGGGEKPAPAPLVKYSMPAALQYEGAVTGSGQISSYDHNDRGGIRTADQEQPAGPGQSSSQASPQVIIQVNAMDSRSFLDHSDDIARAVRAAILNSSSLNDVISEM